MTPITRITEKYNISRHCYADDSQLFGRLPLKNPNGIRKVTMNMNKCIHEFRAWMLSNKLKINDKKTELVIIGSCVALEKLKSLPNVDLTIRVGEETITPSTSARNLGAIFDSNMTMELQVSSMTRRAYFHLRRIQQIRNSINDDTCAKLIHACVTSRLDQHNALLSGCTQRQLHRLQLVQNNAARLLKRLRRRDHVSHVLQDLHWLPINARIEHKITGFVHQALHSTRCPDYIKTMFVPYAPNRTLRSGADGHLVSVPRTRRGAGTKSPMSMGAQLWNSLNQEMRKTASRDNFLKLLKTHLFCSYFTRT